MSEHVGTPLEVAAGMSVACKIYNSSLCCQIRQTREYLDQIGGGNWLGKNWKPSLAGHGLRHWHGMDALEADQQKKSLPG